MIYVNECMTQNVALAEPSMSLRLAAELMRDGDFGVLPIVENDRLVGMVTDRDIVIRAVAEGLNPESTRLGDVMTREVLYCFEDQRIEEVARNMGDNQVRRLPVLDREKRLVGILSLADLALPESDVTSIAESLAMISRPLDFDDRPFA